jgi:sortase (surface protein transpeptidase)
VLVHLPSELVDKVARSNEVQKKHSINQAHRGREGFWWAIFGITTTVAIVSLVGAFPMSDPKSKALSSFKVIQRTPLSTSPTSIRAKSQVIQPMNIVASLPERLIIPSIGIDVNVGVLGLQSNGQVMVPENTQSIGWYSGGVTPGQEGSAVMLGHVDSYQGPGIFFNLKSLVPGATIEVVLADGYVANFAVTRVEQFAKEFFPDQLIYGSNGVRGLQLVTCGGTFNHTTGSYESNIVVFSTLIQPTN